MRSAPPCSGAFSSYSRDYRSSAWLRHSQMALYLNLYLLADCTTVNLPLSTSSTTCARNSAVNLRRFLLTSVLSLGFISILARTPILGAHFMHDSLWRHTRADEGLPTLNGRFTQNIAQIRLKRSNRRQRLVAFWAYLRKTRQRIHRKPN